MNNFRFKDDDCKICPQHHLLRNIQIARELAKQPHAVHWKHVKGDDDYANGLRQLLRQRQNKKYVYFCNGDNEKCNYVEHFNYHKEEMPVTEIVNPPTKARR